MRVMRSVSRSVAVSSLATALCVDLGCVFLFPPVPRKLFVPIPEDYPLRPQPPGASLPGSQVSPECLLSRRDAFGTVSSCLLSDPLQPSAVSGSPARVPCNTLPGPPVVHSTSPYGSIDPKGRRRVMVVTPVTWSILSEKKRVHLH